MMRAFNINGNKFKTPKAFYKHIENEFTCGLGWQTGRNLDVFSDILDGGFGMHDCDEMIKVIWTNMKKSRDNLSTKFYEAVIEIIEEAENVIFEKYEFSKSN